MNTAVFIDAEPYHPVGGGIRTYLRSVLSILSEAKIPCILYTHNPQAYLHGDIRQIGRKPWPNGFLRAFRSPSYKWAHDQVIGFEASLFLAHELQQNFSIHQRFEFCDYNGYAFHSLKIKAIRERLAIRLHTPLFLVHHLESISGILSFQLLKFRELYSLRQCKRIFVPSPTFSNFVFPKLKGEFIPNPTPRFNYFHQNENKNLLTPDFLFAGRWEERKGLIPFIKAFSKFVVDVPEAKLTLIGSPILSKYGIQVTQMSEFQNGLLEKWISIIPEISGDKLKLYSNSSIVVVPSLWENAPYVFQEAMTYGNIALGSMTGEMQDIQSTTHKISAMPGNQESWLFALKELWQRRDEAPEWRNRQWEWLEKRGKISHELIIQTWTHWDVKK